jgi:hypothetical protein
MAGEAPAARRLLAMRSTETTLVFFSMRERERERERRVEGGGVDGQKEEAWVEVEVGSCRSASPSYFSLSILTRH